MKTLTEEHKRNIGNANRGRKISEEQKKKLIIFESGHVPWNKGKKTGVVPWNKGKRGCFSKESVEKNRKNHVGRAAWNKGVAGVFHHSVETRRKIGASLSREKSHLWKGGVTKDRKRVEGSFQYKQWRQSIFIRDKFTCRKCGEVGGRLNAHHYKKMFSQLLQEARENLSLFSLYEAAMAYTPLWDIDNGITLCRKCHKGFHPWMKR